MDKKEHIIIKNLFENEEYSKKISPHLSVNFFETINLSGRIIIDKYIKFVEKYKTNPNYEEVFLSLTDDPKVKDTTLEDLQSIKDSEIEKMNLDYLVDMTESHYQITEASRTIYKCAEILDGKEGKLTKEAIPDMLRDALKITFQNTVGTVYSSDKAIEDQYEYYHNPERRFAFPDWPSFNTAFRGGACKKRLFVYMAGTNVGKSLALEATAVQLLKGGSDVLYVTAEDGELAISERVDGNVLDTRTNELILMDKKDYVSKLKAFKSKSKGRLVIKEYPTASANKNHISALLDELDIKENFKPDFIVIDYLNIFNSCRFKSMGETYVLVKAVTEEMRGLAVERNVGIFTATQSNRGGNGSSDLELMDISDSFGTAMTADVVVAIMETDSLKEEGRYLMKMLKSRLGPITPSTSKWLMGVDKEKQKMYEVPNNQEGLGNEDMSAIAMASPNSPAKKQSKYEMNNF